MLAIDVLVFLLFSSSVYSRQCEVIFSEKVIRCDCSSRRLTFIPTECPRNITDLLLVRNNLNSLGKKYLLDIHNLDIWI